jgi:hypothetical protein
MIGLGSFDWNIAENNLFKYSIFVEIFINIMSEYNRKKLEPEDFYYSEEGYIVFTEKYHLKRGFCCKNGCKHCPYGYSKKHGRIIPKKD